MLVGLLKRKIKGNCMVDTLLFLATLRPWPLDILSSDLKGRRKKLCRGYFDVFFFGGGTERAAVLTVERKTT